MKPMVLHTGRSLTVEERRKRAEAEDVYRVSRLQLVPPDELSPRAKNKFNQIVAEAFWLDALSTDLLAAYCHAWDRWLDCVAAMDGNADVTLDKNARGEIVAKENPYRRPLRTYITIMEEMSSKLALGNVDRLKLTMPAEKKKEVVNPFESFMAEVE